MNPGNARRRARAAEVAAGSLACGSFLARHSAYLDGDLTLAETQVHEAHAAACAACARYASVLQRGTSMLRELPPLLPSSDFHQRLQHRIFHVQDAGALAAERTLRVSWLATAAGVVLIAGCGLLLQLRADGNGPAPADSARQEYPADAAPLAGSWTTPAVPLAPPAAPVPAFAGYSPVVVRPPLYQPVSYELLMGE
ncbi:MAG: hypothetical protein FIB01_10360 [Gemmatimonadetes bacterium]|nr:hypothetical protein [Gemmatimonadota bacterium]